MSAPESRAAPTKLLRRSCGEKSGIVDLLDLRPLARFTRFGLRITFVVIAVERFVDAVLD